MITIPQSVTASRLRLLLSITLVLLFILGGGIFYLGYTKLNTTATETGASVASAKQSETTIQRLRSLQEELNAKKDIVFKASQITANSENYAYQDRLVNDLTLYANRANLAITNISFTSSSSAGAAPAAAPAAGGAMGGSASGGATTAAPSTGSLKKATVDITLESPLNYRNLLNFLHYIEQNLTKLKVSKVGMTKSDGEDVTIDVLNLEVYLK